jgi:hypothetical protein
MSSEDKTIEPSFDEIKSKFIQEQNEIEYKKMLDWCNKNWNKEQVISMLKESIHTELHNYDEDYNIDEMISTKVKFLIENGGYIEADQDPLEIFASELYEIDKDLFDKFIMNCKPYFEPLLLLRDMVGIYEDTRSEIALRMIHLGCNVKHIDNDNRSMIMRELDWIKPSSIHHKCNIVRRNLIQCIETLIKAGADPFHVDARKNTVIDYLLRGEMYHYAYDMIKLFEENKKSKLFTKRVLAFMINDIRKREECKEDFMKIDTSQWFIKDIKSIIYDYLSQIFI